ncbi:MAG: response regulator [Prolixibacteraceae bacterium]|nr:response regulator [Prolixibacteraceae bacterium]
MADLINTRRFLTIIIVLFLFLATNASNVKFYNINNMYGISMREANSVCKDDNGFIWVSSKTGILRLTEDNYKLYNLPYETANIISVKIVYSNPYLVAYTNNGQVFTYNPIYDRFDFTVNLSREFHSNFLSVNSFIINSTDGAYWIGSSTGLIKFQENRAILLSDYRTPVSGLALLSDKQMIMTNTEGVFILDTETLQNDILYKNDNQPLFEVSELYIDRNLNRLWIGTLSSGLYYYSFDEKRLKNILGKELPKQPILAIESISDSTLLIGIDGQGLWEIYKNGLKVMNVYKENIDNPTSLRGNGVYDIFCDKNERVWIATYSGGISYFDQASPIVNQITHIANNPNSLVNNDVNCVIQDERGNLWFGTNNGISCWNVSNDSWKSFYVNKQEQAQVFLTLCEDKKGRIWAGTYSSGVYIFDPLTGKQLAHYSKVVENSPFINDFVFDIFEDSLGDIWIGGINSEVIRYQPDNGNFRKYSVQPINVLSELNIEQMLFGCTYGLTLCNKSTGETSTILDGCLVHDLLVLEGIIWIGTSGDGLIRFDPKDGATEKYTLENGLPSNFVNSIAFSEGFIWLGTESGLCRFDPQEKSVLIYSSILSLSRNSFNRNAQFKLNDGQLAWGTNNGVVVFNPRTIQQEHSKGKIFLEDISISGRSVREISTFKLNKPLDELEKINLKYNQNTIALNFLSIGCESGSKLSWKMEGLDENFTKPSNIGYLSYSNIPSKEYDLRIRLFDNSLSRILAERTLKIEVTPPFWATSWFLAVLILIISTIIYFVFWYSINLIKQRHTEEKVRFFTNTAHDLRTSLTLIKAPIDELVKEKNLSKKGRENITIANEQAVRLSSVVTQLMDFQKVDIGKGQLSLSMTDIVGFVRNCANMFESLAQKREIDICFKTNKKEYHSAIDESLMEKVIDNLISNAVKYSYPKSKVMIDLHCESNRWTLQVKDQGIGVDKKEQKQLFKEFYRGENAVNSKIVGSGIGLLLVKNYVNLHGGEVSFSSQENSGSVFTISVPFKELILDINEKNTERLTAKEQLISNSKVMQALEQTEQEDNQGIRILLVEDNDDLLQFMGSSLSEDFAVMVANDGEDAWEIIKKELPELVVSDVVMPNKDGFELCRLVKSTFETSHIPFILLSALSGKAEQLHGLGLGADDYLTKPFDMALLRQKIKSIIQNREYVRQKALRLIKSSGDEPVLNNELNDQFVKKMLEVVRMNISNSLFNKEDFASAMNVSASLLYKKVKSLTDQSPTDLIKTVRMDYALELLQSKKYNVTEVSELCGFSSIGYFSTVFKKYFGKPPTEILL